MTKTHVSKLCPVPRRSWSGLGSFRAIVGLRLADELESVTVDWLGDRGLAGVLPGVIWDKALSNLAKSPKEQESLFERFGGMLESARESLLDGEDVMLAGIPLVENARDPDITITVHVTGSFETERLGASLRFKPVYRASPQLAEMTLWTAWDWVARAAPDLDRYATVVGGLLHQRSHYRSHGLPGKTDIGKAPFYGTMKWLAGSADS